jgi:hypothetical protein
MKTIAIVELYNLWKKGARNPTNGFYVARYENGRRMQTLKDFENDETGARAYAALWNGPEVA